MKRIRFTEWPLVAILGTLCLFSCHKDDDAPAVEPPTPNYLPDIPTEDVVNDPIMDLAFFMGSDNSEEFQALRRRLSNTAGSLADEELMHVVIAESHSGAIGGDEADFLRAVIARGGNIVVMNPNADTVSKLAQLLGKVVDIPLLPLDHKPLHLMAIKHGKTYFALKTPERTLEGTPGTPSHITGKKMNALVSWLRKPAEQFHFKAEQNDEADKALQDLVAAQEITLDLGLDLYVPTNSGGGWSTHHNIQLVYHIWKAHSFDTNEDFYCMKEEITAYNNDLNCGPEDEDDWFRADDHWNAWENAMSQAGRDPSFEFRADIYGPYMHYISIKNQLSTEGGQAVRVLAYDPENSTSGGVTTTESFSYSLGGNVGASMSGPSGGVSTGLSWGATVAKFSADLSATANLTADGLVSWSYKGARPGTHWGLFTNSHDLARSILKNTCTLHQAWVWSVPSSGPGHVRLQGDYEADDEWLTYYAGNAETFEVYVPAQRVESWAYDIATPPQYKQQWAMTVSPASQAAEDYLRSHLGEDYFWTRGKYTLAQGYDERFGGELAHVVVMQHVSKEKIDMFIADLTAEQPTSISSTPASSQGKTPRKVIDGKQVIIMNQDDKYNIGGQAVNR